MPVATADTARKLEPPVRIAVGRLFKCRETGYGSPGDIRGVGEQP
jgi:hypothetical protein